MVNQRIKIPTISELLSQATALNYDVTLPDDSHIHVYLCLDSNHPTVPILAQFALLIKAGLMEWEDQISRGTEQQPDFSIITYRALHRSIIHLAQKPCEHYRGWIGEIINHFLLHHFVAQHRELLDYNWEAIQPAKMEVTNDELDIVAAYELHNQKLGHISGEVKTYEDLSGAKSNAYSDLQKAQNWSHNRDAQIRSVLNTLLRPRFNVGALQAATLAMDNDRSFLPSLIHCASTQFKRKTTFNDLPQRFDTCTRPAQLIGIQIAITDFGGSCASESLQTGFFENFLRQMRLQAVAWKNPARIPNHV